MDIVNKFNFRNFDSVPDAVVIKDIAETEIEALSLYNESVKYTELASIQKDHHAAISRYTATGKYIHYENAIKFADNLRLLLRLRKDAGAYDTK